MAAVVIDSGSETCRAGFAGFKRHVEERRGAIVSKAIRRGYVDHWPAAEELWRGVMKQFAAKQAGTLSVTCGKDDALSWSGTTVPVLLSEALFNSMRAREKTAEFFFEEANVIGFHTQCSAQLTLYAGGRTSGCVVECGAGSTCAVPIFEGYTLTQNASRLEYGGIDLTTQLTSALKTLGYATSSAGTKGAALGLMTPVDVSRLKEKVGFVMGNAEEFVDLMKSEQAGDGAFTEGLLPDGTKITLGASVCAALAEALFHGGRTGQDDDRTAGAMMMPLGSGSTSPPAVSIQQAVNRAVSGCRDQDGLPPHVIDVLLAGGTTRMRGFKERLAHELARPALKKTRESFPALRVGPTLPLRPEVRESAPWIGGSILASLSSFNNMWVSRREWNEVGAHALRRKCL